MTPTNPTDAQMKLADVTDEDREAAHEFHREMFRRLMDNELSKTLGEEEGDARPIYQAFARHRQATEARAQGLVDALNGYKAAVAFVAADAWDGCSDCIDVLKAARCADTVESLTPDEIAANLKRIRLHFQPPAKHSQHGGERER